MERARECQSTLREEDGAAAFAGVPRVGRRQFSPLKPKRVTPHCRSDTLQQLAFEVFERAEGELNRDGHEQQPPDPGDQAQDDRAEPLPDPIAGLRRRLIQDEEDPAQRRIHR